MSGFDAASNGFAEEYCARQKHLTNTDSSPGVEDDECSFDDAAAEFGQHDTSRYPVATRIDTPISVDGLRGRLQWRRVATF